jgi:DNA-binding transcriptional MerR regulator
MPIKIRGETYYKTSEAAQLAGISRSTLLRWLEGNIIKDALRRDRRGWRLFTKADIERIAEETYKVEQGERLDSGKWKKLTD